MLAILRTRHSKRHFLYEELMPKVAHLQHWQEVPHKVAVLVVLLAICHRRVHPEVLVEEGGRRQPHPVAAVDGGVPVYQQPVEDVPALLPADVQVASRQKACLRPQGGSSSFGTLLACRLLRTCSILAVSMRPLEVNYVLVRFFWQHAA